MADPQQPCAALIAEPDEDAVIPVPVLGELDY